MTFWTFISQNINQTFSIIDQSLVIPVIVATLLSVIVSDIKKEIKVKWIHNLFPKSAFADALDLCLSYGIAMIVGFGITMIVIFLFLIMYNVLLLLPK